jgi:DNA anti-recombination protein RmuC
VTVKNTRPETPAEDARPASDAGNMDKIRDLLVGPQMRDHERKVARLEERLDRELAAMRDELKKGLSLFESFIKQEIDTLSNRLRAEQGDRKTALKELDDEAKAINQRLQQATAQLDEQLASSQRELRQQLLEQQRRLSDDIRDRAIDGAQALKREADELRLLKTDRAALAALFTEVAMRLNDDFDLPGAEHLKND